MSFPWEGWYAVVLEDEPSPPGTRACAGQPLSDRKQAEQLQEFDAVEHVALDAYELVALDPSQNQDETRWLRDLRTPGRKVQGRLHVLTIRRVAHQAYITGQALPTVGRRSPAETRTEGPAATRAED